MRVILLFSILLLHFNANAQNANNLTNGQEGQLKLIEKKMLRIGKQFLSDSSEEERLKGARKFVKLLVQALKIENSFNYPFDSIPYMAKVYSEDRDIRILTFQVVLENYEFRHYGCIQFNTPQLKIIPFNDYSDTFPLTPQYQLSNKNWYGMVYYKMKTMYVGKKKVYLLFGFDQNDILSDKKIIEPMWIENGHKTARFGMPIFDYQDKKYSKNNIIHRYVIEYRTGARAMLKWDEDKKMIIHDHLHPLDNKSHEVGYMNVPDGSYSGLQWNKNSQKWKYIDYIKISDNENNAPIRPKPSKEMQLQGE